MAVRGDIPPEKVMWPPEVSLNMQTHTKKSFLNSNGKTHKSKKVPTTARQHHRGSRGRVGGKAKHVVNTPKKEREVRKTNVKSVKRVCSLL